MALPDGGAACRRHAATTPSFCLQKLQGLRLPSQNSSRSRNVRSPHCVLRKRDKLCFYLEPLLVCVAKCLESWIDKGSRIDPCGVDLLQLGNAGRILKFWVKEWFLEPLFFYWIMYWFELYWLVIPLIESCYVCEPKYTTKGNSLWTLLWIYVILVSREWDNVCM